MISKPQHELGQKTSLCGQESGQRQELWQGTDHSKEWTDLCKSEIQLLG